MPLQNRVTPTAEIVAHPSRGLLMGNRGCLHDPERRLGTARWRSKLWICCVTDFRGWKRDPMPPGRWTALFFLDEATALAAGHRPCAFCRRDDYNAFLANWQHALRTAGRPRAVEIDAHLHSERVAPRTRRQRTRTVPVAGLPDGAMIRSDGAPGLILRDRLLPWSFEGYGAPVDPPDIAELLTPPATVATLAAGYRPLLHPTAAAGPGRRTGPAEPPTRARS